MDRRYISNHNYININEFCRVDFSHRGDGATFPFPLFLLWLPISPIHLKKKSPLLPISPPSSPLFTIAEKYSKTAGLLFDLSVLTRYQNRLTVGVSRNC